MSSSGKSSRGWQGQITSGSAYHAKTFRCCLQGGRAVAEFEEQNLKIRLRSQEEPSGGDAEDRNQQRWKEGGGSVMERRNGYQKHSENTTTGLGIREVRKKEELSFWPFDQVNSGTTHEDNEYRIKSRFEGVERSNFSLWHLDPGTCNYTCYIEGTSQVFILEAECTNGIMHTDGCVGIRFRYLAGIWISKA